MSPSYHYINYIRTIYVDTSVFGGKLDEGFGYWTQKFFDRALQGKIILLKSDVVDDELAGSPKFVWDFVDTLPGSIIQHVELS